MQKFIFLYHVQRILNNQSFSVIFMYGVFW